MKTECPTPDAEKQPQIITLPPPCFTTVCRLHFLNSSFGFHHTMVLLSDPKTLNLLSSQNMTSFHRFWASKWCCRASCKRPSRLGLFINGFFPSDSSVVLLSSLRSACMRADTLLTFLDYHRDNKNDRSKLCIQPDAIPGQLPEAVYPNGHIYLNRHLPESQILESEIPERYCVHNFDRSFLLIFFINRVLFETYFIFTLQNLWS